MEEEFAEETKLVQMLNEASRKHDIEAMKIILMRVPANVKDEENSSSPLHEVVLGCTENKFSCTLDTGIRAMDLLLENGAVWNELNSDAETPGCIALRCGFSPLYEKLVDAGVRAELLLERLRALSESNLNDDGNEDNVVTLLDNQDYLSRRLISLPDHGLLDNEGNAVMMNWETCIMKAHAEALLPDKSLRILNIGHGIGIFDSLVQENHKPDAHFIIEAHSDVLKLMVQHNWINAEDLKSTLNCVKASSSREGVSVCPGTWQSVVPKLIDLIENKVIKPFNAIYFDTFGESYNDMKSFFNYVPQLIDQDNGLFGFFHGAGADRRICYDVYKHIVSMDLHELGFSVQWKEIPVPNLEAAGEWTGVKHAYWTLPTYWLPTCSLNQSFQH